MSDEITIPDELMEKHFNPSDTIDEPAEAPVPDAEDTEPEEVEQDTLIEEDPDEEPLETEELEAGDDDPVDEDEFEEEDDLEVVEDEDLEDLEDLEEEEVEEPEDTLETDEDEDDSFLPDFDRKKIEENPELNAAYKHMRAKWTQAQQDLRHAQREFEVKSSELDEFAEQLGTPEGAKDFLVTVALNRPEVFEQAYQAAVSLTSDEDQRQSWEREQDVKRRERQIQRQEAVAQQEKAMEQIRQVTESTHSVAEGLGLTSPAEIELAEQAVANVITANRRNDPTFLPGDADIKKAVERVASSIEATKERTRKELEAKYAKERKKKVKKKAKSAKRSTPPNSSSSPAIKSKKAPEPPSNVDPLDFWVDRKLGITE